MSKSKLTITFPDGTLTPFDLQLPSITVGSGIQSTVIVPHDSVAESHIELTLDVSGYLITDLVGDGATKLNGHPLEKGVAYQLEGGTLIQLGEVEAFYEYEPDPEPVAPPAPVDFPVPGSFPRPVHPPGVFAPLKKRTNMMLVLGVALTVIAILAAAYIGASTAEITVPH